MKVIRHITSAQRRWERQQEQQALADFRAMPPEERQRMLEGLRRMTDHHRARDARSEGRETMTVADARAYVGGLRRTKQYRRSYWYVVVMDAGERPTGFNMARTYQQATGIARGHQSIGRPVAIVHGRDC